jgi:enoyl-CoA hydratase
MTDVLLQEDTDGVRVLTLNRPGARNALSTELAAALHATLSAAAADEEVRVLVLTGADPAFFQRAGTADCIAQVGSMAKPVIGAVNGATFTGGLELALGCDFLIASDRAIFADTHARVGILPRGGMTARLPLVVGGAQARRMSMTGQVIDAATAERIGLVTEVVPHDRLMARVMDCARAIAEVPPDTVRGLKEMYVAQAGVAPVLAGEREIARRHVPDWAGLEKRRLDVMARNRAQIGGGQA